MRQPLAFSIALLMSFFLFVGHVTASTDHRAVEYSLAPPPPGLSDLCSQYPEQCLETRDTRTAVPLKDVRDIVPIIQRGVNARLSYDRDNPSWRPWATVGNCVTYALEKRWHLVQKGFPPKALRLAYVLGRGGDKKPFFHLVLVIIVEDGEDLILDNRKHYPVFKYQTEYIWISMQSPGDPDSWIRLGYTSSENVLF